MIIRPSRPRPVLVSLRTTPEVNNALEELAATYSTTKSDIAHQIIEDYFNRGGKAK